MGFVSIGCGKCEQRLECQSPQLEGETAQRVHDELIEMRIPLGMSFNFDDDGHDINRSVTRPISNCETGECPMPPEDFASAGRIILEKVTQG